MRFEIHRKFCVFDEKPCEGAEWNEQEMRWELEVADLAGLLRLSRETESPVLVLEVAENEGLSVLEIMSPGRDDE